ncbi:MAG: molybdopterin molybdotransferase MoeA [Planctomycetota bacterium]
MNKRRADSLLPAMATPHAAAAAWRDRLTPVATETVTPGDAVGRILAEDVTADRDSPAADVSAMDGYAVRLRDLTPGGSLPVAFAVQTGVAPPPLPAGAAARLFTGGVVPEGADTVVKREDADESAPGTFTPRPDATSPDAGQHIRRRGENAARGDVLLRHGSPITPAAAVTLAAVGCPTPGVYRRVRVVVLVTGNEVRPASGGVDDPEVRDSNGPGLAALLRGSAWCELVSVERVADTPAATRAAFADAAARADVVLSTGGVSMGDHDHVPAAALALGAEVLYHHLSMRPGKPNFGAVLPDGTAVVALPGNPVSAFVGTVVLGGPALRRRGGWAEEPQRQRVLVDPGRPPVPATLGLWRYLPATVHTDGRAAPLANRGSGDVAALGPSHGLLELPPDTPIDAGDAAWPWLGWGVS